MAQGLYNETECMAWYYFPATAVQMLGFSIGSWSVQSVISNATANAMSWDMEGQAY